MKKAVQKLAAGILFRINPEKCNYEQLDVLGNVFSTATRENLLRSGVGPGTRLFALASKSDMKRGMLGEWLVTEEPVQEGQSEEQLLFFTPEYRAERVKVQWRVTAQLHNNIHARHGDNLHLLADSELSDLRKVQSIRVLNEGQVARLHTLYSLSDTRRHLHCTECSARWIAETKTNTCPMCHHYQSRGEAHCAAYLRELKNADGSAIQMFYDKPLWCECRSACACGLPQSRCFESRRRYDFIFRYNGRWYIVEYDGEQHFKQMYWHTSQEDFLDRQDIDKAKNHGALACGFTMLRLSCDDPKHIARTLHHFLTLERKEPFLGVDDEIKYAHMRLPLSTSAVLRHFPPGRLQTLSELRVELYPPQVGTTIPKKRSRLVIVGATPLPL